MLQELIQREKIFVDDMANMVKDVLPPLKPNMPPLDYQRLFMFGNVFIFIHIFIVFPTVLF